MQGYFRKNHRFVRLPGSQACDIPVPPELQPQAKPLLPSGYALLQPFLQKQGRKLHPILGDGNCLFRALSHQLTGNEQGHVTLRQVIVQFEASNPQIFARMVVAINQKEFSEHSDSVKKIFVWGSGVEIQAAAFLFQMEVYEVTDSYVVGEATWLRFKPHNTSLLNGLSLVKQIELTNTHKWMEIAHVTGSHSYMFLSLLWGVKGLSACFRSDDVILRKRLHGT